MLIEHFEVRHIKRTALPLLSPIIRLMLLLSLTLGLSSPAFSRPSAVSITNPAMAACHMSGAPKGHAAMPSAHDSADMHGQSGKHHSGKVDCCTAQCQPVYLPTFAALAALRERAKVSLIAASGFPLEAGPRRLLLRPPILT
jgi:hypothetical protein